MKPVPLLLAAIAFLVVVPIKAAEDQAPTRKPNVVVILSDDAGYHEFSCQGNANIPTPRIDSIAKAGVRFTQAYVSGTVCSPSRAGLLSGRYQQRFGHELNIPPAYSETNGLPLTETLLPRVLKDAGYRTIALGKWHLGYAPKFHPMERGFTDYYGFLQGSRSYWPLAKPGRLNCLMLDREPVEKESFEYMTDHLAEKAAEYMGRHKDHPFFIYLAFNATHGPLHATEADLAKAGGNKVKAMTIALDRAVGIVLDALETQGLTKDTLVFFLNDNGGASGRNNKPLRGHKGSSWEGGIRVPFLVQWPGTIPSAQVKSEPVIALDIFPTALAAAGIGKSPGKPLDGIDLLPLMTGKTENPTPRTLYWKTGSPWAVRDGDLKLVGGNPGQAPGEAKLFDLSQDIGETQDLAKERPDEVKRLQALYQNWAATHQPTPWGRGAKANDDPKPRKRKPKP
ncbi:MAG: sulfatase-like hydrolase/transferase [Akkermansiaceae bacterium]|jgi:arylsulfatase A-like enzyme|nr:sulfatase-like hydrolase/transferase [Akkermansiaceae bacterium]